MAKDKLAGGVPADNDGRERALEEALKQIQRQFGQGAIMKMDGSTGFGNVDVISTGSISLDIATGVGGLPKGRIIEIYGPESSGKGRVYRRRACS